MEFKTNWASQILKIAQHFYDIFKVRVLLIPQKLCNYIFKRIPCWPLNIVHHLFKVVIFHQLTNVRTNKNSLLQLCFRQTRRLAWKVFRASFLFCFIVPSLIWSGRRRTFLGSTKDSKCTFFSPTFNVLFSHISWLQCLALAWLSPSQRVQGNFV